MIQQNDMSKKSSFFALLCRLKIITRWNGTKVYECDDVMEHSYRVILISYLLYIIRKHSGLNVPDLGQLLVNAMLHDAADAVLTHIPTNVRGYNCNIKGDYKILKKTSMEYIMNLLPQEYSKEDIFSDSLINCIIESADFLDGYYKAKRELELGNMEFRIIFDSYENELKQRINKFKEIEVFVELFLNEIDLYGKYRYLEV